MSRRGIGPGSGRPGPGLAERRANWPLPENAPHRGAFPPELIDWFGEGAAALRNLLATCHPAEPVWTWSRERSVGFWQRMQAIEAAVHRWDAENAIGTPGPVDRQLAMDAVTHTFEVMAPARRAGREAPPGAGERLRFRQSDGSRIWIVQTDPDEVLLNAGSGCCDVELTATASDLMLFLWHRIPLDGLEVRGDASLLDRYSSWSRPSRTPADRNVTGTSPDRPRAARPQRRQRYCSVD
ncbi:maleylpyruvate isomerase family mycothiol-dependent enzyme [Streptomyces melanogenes]|uniref:maleylpyruvate isomerase family mycothiol-dependent enzyme n=1 Tax=Streptomyces melanogenes TaxID=67326 RepID=UPI003796E020